MRVEEENKIHFSHAVLFQSFTFYISVQISAQVTAMKYKLVEIITWYLVSLKVIDIDSCVRIYLSYANNGSLMFVYLNLKISQGEYEFESVEMKNCDKESIIKILPDSSFKINAKCELIANVCHNITEVSKPVKANTIIYQNAMTLFNLTRESGCKFLKSQADQSLVKTVWVLNGLRQCNEQKRGIFCRHSTSFKYDKEGKRTLKMLTMTITTGGIYRLRNELMFENGKSSCTEVNLIAKRIYL